MPEKQYRNPRISRLYFGAVIAVVLALLAVSASINTTRDWVIP